jgi:hypothetical protein
MTEPAERRSEIVAPEDVTQRYALEQTRMSLESGFLGKFFGAATNAPTNIAGLIALLLTLSCIVSLFFPSNIPALEFLKLVLPVITGVLGYLFGKSTRE